MSNSSWRSAISDRQPVVAGPSRKLLVDCPACARKTEYSPTNRWRPFCSERCKHIDLGAWASEQYRIAGAPVDPTDPAEIRPEDDPSARPVH